MEDAEVTPLLVCPEMEPERALGLCPEQGPILPAGVGQSRWACESWAGVRADSPCRGGSLSPDSGSPARARAGAGVSARVGGRGGFPWGIGALAPGAGVPAGTEICSSQCAGQYRAGPVSLGGEVSGLDLPSVDPWVLRP